jgi:tRNA A-37 threonylcarbamoyl transferase component Bud32
MADYIYVHPDYADFLRGNGLLNLNRLLDWSEGSLVSRHDHRRCRQISVQTDAGQRKLFLRQEFHVPCREILSDMAGFRRPTSRVIKMLQAAELFTKNGIPVAEVCGVIERRHLGKPFSAAAIQAPAPGEDIYTRLLRYGRCNTRKVNPIARQRLMYELGAFLARIHFAKIDWPDLAAKHIFVDQIASDDSSDQWWRFTLIDVEQARPGLNAKNRQKQLGRFFHSLRGVISPTDLMRVALGYIGLNKVHPRAVRRSLWQKFFPQGTKWMKELRADFRALRAFPEDRPLPEEENYERIGPMVVNVRFKEVLQEQGLLEPGKIFTFQKGSELYKPGLGRRFRMRFEAIVEGRRSWFYLKRVHHPKLKDQWDRMLCGTVRHSGCGHERRMIKALEQCRIPVPVVVAYAEKMTGCYERASALITEGIVGQSLEKYVPKHFGRGGDHEEVLRRRRWIRKLAELIGRFHRSGFCHRDLYLSHIFIGFRKNGEPIFHLIDMGRCFQMGLRRERWIVKDLAALEFSSPKFIISQTDRLRFFKTCMGKTKLDAQDKKLLRNIVRKCRQIDRHTQKHHKVTKERAVK